MKWWCYDPLVPWKILIPQPLGSIGMGGLFTLMGSMIADVCDMDELETGKRREGMFGSIYWWMVKLGMALAFAASGYLLNWTGFDVSLGGAQSNTTFFWMRVVDVGVPAVAAGISIFAVSLYKLTEQRSQEIRLELDKRHGKIKA
ncbi:MAG: hypothetical protein OMM_04234 [Candidatus Magnetoglobus multicellularis str. Araruama]|uniref:Uncharacterized protein n=1 Tax=Candidatus Magnetoglobus multicellularis str. Araruama TaxID=890399 RepID=A0A1V1P2E8_9BACT|nr:MAG: hypothetical protein OMM_04234 [Candidatus Magnetoglobus multicellularis str. Araruama]